VVAETTLPGPGDGVALDEARDRVVVSTLLGDGVAILSRGAPAAPAVVRFSPPSDDAVSRGARLFYMSGEPRIADDGRACATCHIAGQSDGLVWRTRRGPRRTPSLAGRVDRDGPFGWNGESRDLATHVTTTIARNLGGEGLADHDLADLVAYLRAMPRPRRAAPGRGAEAFAAAGCGSCHVGGGGTDGERHDVGSGGSFVTPSLVGLGHSRSYFHDARYRSVDELLAKTQDKMGAPVTEQDRAALAAYLDSL
jgi:mono/diheme cytochrome c family protein